ncbi:MAG TPA: hypothetical protein VJ992_03935 [Gemmatimonadales bacterium]|nr:hypothetical protein [Gemmatimonadales bacterium]
MRTICVLALALGASACVAPTDRSGELSVQLAALPPLFIKDTVRLSAHVVDQSGADVPNALVSFSTSDPGVITIDSLGWLRAVGVGSATLTVSAVGFAQATPVNRTVNVLAALEVDSIRPMTARFGELVTLYGAGLDKDSLFQTSIGGEDAQVAGYQAVDPQHPNRLGKLVVWMPPPAPRRSVLTVLGFNGGVVFPDSLNVIQHDLYEPDDTVPADLGPLPDGFNNPALALEPQPRTDTKTPADWYTFTNTQTQDRTILFYSKLGATQSVGVFMTDSLAWSSAKQTWVVGPRAWTIGPKSAVCSGLTIQQNGAPVEIKESLFPLSVIALKNLPAGTYHIIAPYVPTGQPIPYQLTIVNQYASVLPPDADEENDYCDVATPFPIGSSASLTIDNPHDLDWFKFSVTAATPFSAVATASDSAGDPDLYLIHDFRPDSLVAVDIARTAGPVEKLSVGSLPVGNYFLLVVDWVGTATPYTLTTSASLLPAPVAAVPRRATAWTPVWTPRGRERP